MPALKLVHNADESTERGAPIHDADPTAWALWHADLARAALRKPEPTPSGWMPDFERAFEHCRLAGKFDRYIGAAVQSYVDGLHDELVSVLSAFAGEPRAKRARKKSAHGAEFRRMAKELFDREVSP